EQRGRFVAALLAAATPGSRMRVVLGVRADAYGRCVEIPALAAALQDRTLLIGPMTAPQLREAITRPARTGGLMVEADLASTLVAESAGNPGVLPLISHALLQTWYRRRGNALTLAAYTAAGTVAGAVAKTAEEMYVSLSEAQRHVLRDLLLRMV